MSLFGPPIKYSQIKHPLPSIQIERIISRIHLANINSENKETVKEKILSARTNEMISLQKIYETLHHLKTNGTITKYDEEDFMKAFEEYYKEHFPD